MTGTVAHAAAGTGGTRTHVHCLDGFRARIIGANLPNLGSSPWSCHVPSLQIPPSHTWAALALGSLIAPLAVLSAAPGRARLLRPVSGEGFRLVNLATGATVASGEVERTIPAGNLGAAGARFRVRGRLVSSAILRVVLAPSYRRQGV